MKNSTFTIHLYDALGQIIPHSLLVPLKDTEWFLTIIGTGKSRRVLSVDIRILHVDNSEMISARKIAKRNNAVSASKVVVSVQQSVKGMYVDTEKEKCISFVLA